MEFPLRIENNYACGYSRFSRAIVDANGEAVLVENPSQDEYVPACSEAVLDGILELLSACHAYQKEQTFEWDSVAVRLEKAIDNLEGIG